MWGEIHETYRKPSILQATLASLRSHEPSQILAHGLMEFHRTNKVPLSVALGSVAGGCNLTSKLDEPENMTNWI